jgi:hypothetical protein
VNRRLETHEYVKTLAAWSELYQPVLPRELEAWARDLCSGYGALPYLDSLRCERCDRDAEHLVLRGTLNLTFANAGPVEADVVTVWQRDVAAGASTIFALASGAEELSFWFAARNLEQRYVAGRLALVWKR